MNFHWNHIYAAAQHSCFIKSFRLDKLMHSHALSLSLFNCELMCLQYVACWNLYTLVSVCSDRKYTCTVHTYKYVNLNWNRLPFWSLLSLLCDWCQIHSKSFHHIRIDMWPQLAHIRPTMCVMCMYAAHIHVCAACSVQFTTRRFPQIGRAYWVDAPVVNDLLLNGSCCV